MITDRIDWNREDFTIAPISTEISVTDISLTLEGEITYNMKFAANTNADKVGMLVWTQEQYRNGETSAEDALVVYANPEDISADAFYVGYTGIVARTMGDTFFTAAFVEEDGVFTYSKVNRCSVDHAAQLILRKDTIPEYKALAKTLVAYGDYAQEYFAKK